MLTPINSSDLEFQTGSNPVYPYTGNTTFNYIGIGTSRINEFEKYGGGYNFSNTQHCKLVGSNTQTGSLVTGHTETGSIAYTGYCFTYTGTNTNATIYYRDRADGFTEIAGNTSGYTKEEVFHQSITRNEHFLGFVDEPRVYSDLFVDRGKQSVQERNLRLGEIDSVGELRIYGNGYFKVRKQ